MSWPKGAEIVQGLLDHGHLEQVPANPDEAAYLIEKARLHLQTARSLAEVDPEIAYDALYAAARKEPLAPVFWSRHGCRTAWSAPLR